MPAAKAAPVYALVPLSYQGKPYMPGERIDTSIPPEVLKPVVDRGDAGKTKPKA